ncbi:hypothetical protein BT96DRAFT_915524 [Gymnopus androsaceus JB14]|uniref:Nnf1-domain-containing protein n=1 Tax=Gymnopus androsaceus JB14 TaxID=1447944 RepID=A0A6A4IBX5_9AGAR|nr:hypothetical protein BT96DRAFT_915524 [Gymnopus androsaceus JB14]
MFNQSGSRRWEHFQTGLQLAVQKTARKWTYEDFKECFPLYAEEQGDNASATFNTISEYIERQALSDLEKILERYNLRENIDMLHDIVTQAKERQKAGIEPGNDTWREDLDTRSAICARTVPVLEEEAKKLRESLAALEASNSEMENEIRANVQAADDADACSLLLFKQLHGILDEWKNVSPEIEEWSITASEKSHSRIET